MKVYLDASPTKEIVDDNLTERCQGYYQEEKGIHLVRHSDESIEQMYVKIACQDMTKQIDISCWCQFN